MALLGLTLAPAGAGCTAIFSATSGDAGPGTDPAIDAQSNDNGDANSNPLIDDPDVLGCGASLSDTIVRFPVDGSDGNMRLLTSSGVPVGDGTRTESITDATLQPTDLLGTSGPDGCGTALQVQSAAAGSFVRIRDTDFDGVQSVDFWFKLEQSLPSTERFGALLSKDSAGGHDGDLLVVLYDDGPDVRVGMRIQAGVADHYEACSEAIIVGEWHHVAVSFSSTVGAMLYVDGVRGDYEMGDFGGPQLQAGDCDLVNDSTSPARTMLLDNNPNHWMWGASNHAVRPEGGLPTGTLIDYNVVPLLLDELRFRSKPFTPEEASDAHAAVASP